MTRRRGSWLWRCQDPGAPHGANTGLERGPPEAVLLGPPKLRAFPDQLLRIQSDIPDRGWKQSSQRDSGDRPPPPPTAASYPNLPNPKLGARILRREHMQALHVSLRVFFFPKLATIFPASP